MIQLISKWLTFREKYWNYRNLGYSPEQARIKAEWHIK
jgi:hypothetical protein